MGVGEGVGGGESGHGTASRAELSFVVRPQRFGPDRKTVRGPALIFKTINAGGPKTL